MECSRSLCLFLVSFSILAASVYANVEFDAYWIERAKQARLNNIAAYKQENITTPQQIYEAMQKNKNTNTTRAGSRQLRGRRGRRGRSTKHCKTTNPIDNCWRCDPHWADDRQRLVTCAKGFGRFTKGGMGGKTYVVTDSSDDYQNPKEGTLRWGAIQLEPLWIIFDHDMTIVLKEELIVQSFKTFDGRGANVHIANGGSVTIQFVHNIIIHNIHIHDIIRTGPNSIINSPGRLGDRRKTDGDAICIFGSSNIWIDHVYLANAIDGLIDAIDGSTGITVSNTYFENHVHACLFGASADHPQDKVLRATFVYNHFARNLVERMPRVRYGFVQVVNNKYDHCTEYCVGGSEGPTIISQGNKFIKKITGDKNIDSNKEVTRRQYASGENKVSDDWVYWNWKSEMDMFVNGAVFKESGYQTIAEVTSKFNRGDIIKPKQADYTERLTRHAGVLRCRVGRPC